MAGSAPPRTASSFQDRSAASWIPVFMPDFGSAAGRLPVAEGLAWSVREGLADAGFDIALSYALTVDHGTVQSYEMISGRAGVPIVPLVVNTAAPPLPALHRCVSLGRALGAALRSSGHPGRVLVAASGGLSHWLPSNDPRDPSVAATAGRS
nr:hypothetical protein [Actinomadura madurae]